MRSASKDSATGSSASRRGSAPPSQVGGIATGGEKSGGTRGGGGGSANGDPPPISQTASRYTNRTQEVSWRISAWRTQAGQFWDRVSTHPLVRWPLDSWLAFKRRSAPWCLRTIEGPGFQCTMFLITVYALVGDDIRVASSQKPADVTFNIITIVTLGLFTFELIASCIGKDDYFLSFFFFLDLIATMSLILDITWVYEKIVLGGDTSMARAGRMSRVGTRAGRVIRVIRVIRLIRIVKLYRHIFDALNRFRGRQEEDLSRPGRENAQEEVYAESRVGQKLSQMMTQKVILLILSMLLCLPMFTVDQWFQSLSTAAQYGADAVGRAYSECWDATQNDDANKDLYCETFEQQLTLYIGEHHVNNYETCQTTMDVVFSDSCKLGLGWVGFVQSKPFTGFQQKTAQEHWEYLFVDASIGIDTLPPDLVTRLNSGGSSCTDETYNFISLVTLPEDGCPDDIRLSERSVIEPNAVVSRYLDMLFVFDLRPYTHRTAVFSMMQTGFVCLILAVGAMVFSHDANVLVLQPIERMIALVKQIRDNPLYAMKLGDESYRDGNEEEEEAPQKRKSKWRWCPCRRSQHVKEQAMETKILENAIVKLGTLLALGFGEAGSEIIVKNMREDTAKVNAMIPGSKVEAVFGFCNIMNFTDTTEVLQDKVMVFVNSVAEIVHAIVDEWHGAANQNNGEAFLIVWRLRDEDTPQVRAKLCDMAVISFVHVHAAVNKSPVLKEYSEHPALLARMPNYRVRLKFGLHSGWAIEGAIGSDFKIDASYLSPHVNIASQLEIATQLYGVSLCISANLANLCSLAMQAHFRVIDRITLRGVISQPMRLVTIDLYAGALQGSYYPNPKGAANPYEVRLKKEKVREAKMQITFQVHQHFEQDIDITAMRSPFTARFYEEYNKGFYNYEAGEWDVASRAFEKTRTMISPPDGPSKALLEYMASCGFDARR
eukprot:CAMPEP_0206584772 /NCGR_PEP_ID=MMETSP0325_2-20121206/35963_1 /ASSEMBLY_ACC=CAM_ASM_000347 /TAXON_ID=2866 /ORGANISM="Crypthecodinium cohnii, Strain Seligo" /LENGTH=943 /DNA_ID=CAMNT_0054092077 /DNA_START=70 /DNA_END=2898 /DNA_ORIENTATION=-